MSVYRKIKKIAKRDGLKCRLCERSIDREWDRLMRLYDWRHATSVERIERGLKKVDRNSINLSIEHVLPLSRGGTNDRANLALAHRTCNGEKGKMTIEEYLFGKIPV